MVASNPLQSSAKWLADRCGYLTASRFADALAISKRDGKPLKARLDLVDTLIAERVTGDTIGIGQTPAMAWGAENEEFARDAYEAETGHMVTLSGFVPHPEIAWLGASPDGLVGTDGLIEIKCPNTTTHLRRVRAGVVPEEYKPQMLLQLLCTGRAWCDFVDYDPRLDDRFEHLRLFVVRYKPTQAERDEALEAAKAFLDEVEKEMQALLER